MNTLGNQTTLTWDSLPDRSWVIEISDDFTSWDSEPGGESVASQGTSTTHVLDYDSPPSRRFYSLRKTP
ncbi:hypothetical protein [Haloferula sp. A504]|uniref:hypothetical protein n=1 Tax=Haloferula sp. A504 TaxID=3373601 RepID=UPI0031C8BB6D|nr:hypothetical protein [Verrucomicrobiaceae bacterium E54]